MANHYVWPDNDVEALLNSTQEYKVSSKKYMQSDFCLPEPGNKPCLNAPAGII